MSLCALPLNMSLWNDQNNVFRLKFQPKKKKLKGVNWKAVRGWNLRNES